MPPRCQLLVNTLMTCWSEVLDFANTDGVFFFKTQQSNEAVICHLFLSLQSGRSQVILVLLA